MSMYLSNSDLQPTGSETVEFLDEPEPAPFPAVRSYVGDGITVHWHADRCIHSERCTSGLPAVFDKSARPWVDPHAAPADEIARLIDTCPSGALSYTRTDGAAPGVADTRTDGEVLVTIRPQADGPLSIEGPVALVRPDGETEIAHRLTLCRCGHSGSKPRCDGSHARVGFQAPGVPT